MTLEQAEADLIDAMLKGDAHRLDALLSDDLIFISHTGTALTKTDDVQAHRSRILKLSKVLPSETAIRRLQGGAVVTVRVTLEGSYDSQPFFGDYRYTRVWEHRDNRWVVVSAHASEIKG